VSFVVETGDTAPFSRSSTCAVPSVLFLERAKARRLGDGLFFEVPSEGLRSPTLSPCSIHFVDEHSFPARPKGSRRLFLPFDIYPFPSLSRHSFALRPFGRVDGIFLEKNISTEELFRSSYLFTFAPLMVKGKFPLRWRNTEGPPSLKAPFAQRPSRLYSDTPLSPTTFSEEGLDFFLCSFSLKEALFRSVSLGPTPPRIRGIDFGIPFFRGLPRLPSNGLCSIHLRCSASLYPIRVVCSLLQCSALPDNLYLSSFLLT